MTRYDFDSLKSDLVEAVINAFMRRNAAYIIDGSCAEGRFRYIEPPHRKGQAAVNLYVTYPGGEWSEPGGLLGSPTPSSYKPFDAARVYGEIEGFINAAVNPYLAAPQPRDFNDQIRILQWAAQELAVGGTVQISGEGSGTTIDVGNKEVPIYIDSIRNELSDLNGVAVKTLRDYYGGARIEDVLSGQYALAVVAGTLVAGEKQIWKQLQQDLAQLLEMGAKAFNQFAVGNEVSLAEYVDIVDAVTDAAGLFALPVGAAKAIGKAAKISSLVKNFMPPAPEKIAYKIKGGTYLEMVDSLYTSIQTLQASIFEAEKVFNACGDDAIREVFSNFAAFDNKRPKRFLNAGEEGIHNDANGTPGNEAVINDALRTVASRYELIADHCQSVAKRLDGAANKSPWFRPAQIAANPWGHYGNYEILVLALAALLRNAAGEMHDVGEKCLFVLSDFRATDAEIKRQIDRLADRTEKEVRSHL